MLARSPGKLLLLIGLLAAGTGCGSKTPTVSVESMYPVRDAWLVAGTPKASPTKWYEPGFPPLIALSLPRERWTADQEALSKDIGSQNILDTRAIDSAERNDFQAGLNKLFGTPEQPKIEAVSADVKQTIDGLKLDPDTLAKGGELFRNYCMNCHGLTGNGNGPAAKYLQPLPRDYRQGIFKFITTQPLTAGTKPRRADLYRTIKKGLDGAPMPSFAGLSDSDVEAIISHVIYLSMRGETEYQTMKDSLKIGPEDTIEALTTNFKAIAPRWLRSDQNPIVPDEDMVKTDEEFLASAARGHELFMDGQQGACTTCHVNYGKNSPYQYDAWGGIVKPRNLLVATKRGGRSKEEIYARLYGGIPGSGMPSHVHLMPTPEERVKGVHKIWDLVHFVQAVSNNETRDKLTKRYDIKFE